MESKSTAENHIYQSGCAVESTSASHRHIHTYTDHIQTTHTQHVGKKKKMIVTLKWQNCGIHPT